MSEQWPKVPLGQVLRQVERPEPVDPEKTYRLLGVRWYAEGLFIKDTCSGSSIQAAKVYKVQAGDFVYNRLFAWKGSFAIAQTEHGDCYVSNEFPCFETNTERVDPRYLQRYFSVESSWLEALGLSSGGTPTSRNRLKEERFLAMEIPLPPLPEQRRIVAWVEELAGRIAEAKGLQTEADDHLASFTASTHVELAAGREVSVNVFLDLEEDQVEVDASRSYPQVGVKGFGGGLFSKTALAGSNTTYRHFNRLFDGALVLSQVKGWEGAVAVADSTLAGWFVSPEYRTFRCKPREADPDYLRYLVATPWFWSKLKSLTRGVGARRERTRPEHFLALRLLLPTIEDQATAVRLFEKVHRIPRLRARMELDALLPSILDKAFRGEL